jgi:amino acid transporter
VAVDPVSQPDNEVPPPFGVLVRELIARVIAWFDAEREIYDIQVRLARRAAGWSALFALAAVVVAQGAMIALVVGVLLSLTPVIGAARATVAILLVCLVTAALFIWLIRLKLRSVKESWRRRNDG